MTEILDSGDERSGRPERRPDPLARRPVEWVADPADPDGTSDIANLADGADGADGADDAWADWADNGRDPGSGGLRSLLRAVREPASLAVAATLCLLVSTAVGPGYRFDAYPFNEGLSSLNGVFGGQLDIRPLHAYLLSAAPTIALVLVGLLAAAAALLRSGPRQAGWVRPLAAGALITAVVLAALLGAGAYRTSTYDLTPARQAQAATSS
jgi:hypothetical protein